MRLSLQILDRAPGASVAATPTRQVWLGGATDLTTRRMIAEPRHWLVLADHDSDHTAATEATPLLAWELQQIVPGDQVSPSHAGGVILVSMDVDPAHEDEFNDWYNMEHIPHFSRVPGVIAARRFRALCGAPRYVALYHVEDTGVYATPAWMAANETPWILRMRRFQRNRTYFMFRTPVAIGAA
ncbi:MAG TPA: hypothetical protein VGG99_12025 [Acetobacteraceae bacterium]|jgi:hypothetical protein